MFLLKKYMYATKWIFRVWVKINNRDSTWISIKVLSDWCLRLYTLLIRHWPTLWLEEIGQYLVKTHDHLHAAGRLLFKKYLTLVGIYVTYKIGAIAYRYQQIDMKLCLNYIHTCIF